MNPLRLAARGIAVRPRAFIALVFAAALATAVVSGALSLGDSVRASLKREAAARIGRIDGAWMSGERLFRTALAGWVFQETGRPAAAVLFLRGGALGQRSEGDGLRAGNVAVLGVDTRFWQMGAIAEPRFERDGEDGVAINEALARAAGVGLGDRIVLRIEKPSLLSRDAPLSKVDDSFVVMNVPITDILGPDRFGKFALDANLVPQANVYVSRERLQREVGVGDRSNLLLVGRRPGGDPRDDHDAGLSDATAALWKHWKLADAGLELRRQGTFTELRTTRVFLEPVVSDRAGGLDGRSERILTYFVNGIAARGRETPYSTVTATSRPPGTPDLADDEVLVNEWLARDLGIGTGDTVTLRYWVVGRMRRLVEERARFRVRAVLPENGPHTDPTLMPDIPGLADKKDCRDWEPGVPIDLRKIRNKDQQWWSAHRGAPKAFLTLASGQKIWRNRFGNLTAIRWQSNPDHLATKLGEAINPATLGAILTPVAENARRAAEPTMDFGQLFLGLSLFLVVAALVLTSLVFGLGVEGRAAEVGLLRAVGWDTRKVRAVFLWEALAAGGCAAIVGTLASIGYARSMVAGLSGPWRGAVVGMQVPLSLEPGTLIAGALVGFIASILVLLVVLRTLGRRSIRAQISGQPSSAAGGHSDASNRRVGLVRWISLLGGFALAAKAIMGSDGAGTAYFFGSGTLLLVAGIAHARWAILGGDEAGGGSVPNARALATRFAARNCGRSLAAVTVFACGTFLVVAVGANRKDFARDAQARSSGTGGFAWWVETSLPIYRDPAAPDAADQYGWNPDIMAKAGFVPMRLREGDEASCLNMNRPVEPRVLGVDPELFRKRGAFGDSARDPWKSLDSEAEPFPAIVDANTLEWSLHRRVGDHIEVADDQGRRRRLRIVASVPNSVLQGHLVVSERTFETMYPNRSGYRVFLVDAPRSVARAVGAAISTGWEDAGADVVSTVDRLEAFQSVENTYLAIFGVLGGLGLLLGTAGLGVVVSRNLLERRTEIAVLRAMGFDRRTVLGLVVREHARLLGMGLAVGAGSALIAVAPSLRLGAPLSTWGALCGILALVAAVGIGWVWLAARSVSDDRLLEGLRDE